MMRTEKEVIDRINYLKNQIALAENRIRLYNYPRSLLETEKELMSDLSRNIGILEWTLGENNCAREEFGSKISRITDYVPSNETHKKCPRCGNAKSVNEFYLGVTIGKKSRTSTYCKVCKKNYDKERYEVARAAIEI